MANNLWTPSLSQSVDFRPFLERITCRLQGTSPVEFPKTDTGLLLPGFEATREFADEVWLLTANMPMRLEKGLSNNQVDIGFYEGENPSLVTGRLRRALFGFFPNGQNNVIDFTWTELMWIAPKVKIGETQKFSIWINVQGDTGALSSAVRFWPHGSIFTLERMRGGPGFRMLPKKVSEIQLV